MYCSMPLMSALAAPVLASSSGTFNPFASMVPQASNPLAANNDGTALTRPVRLLVTMMPDDSGSISSYGNAPAIRRGHNAQLDTYQDNPDILVRTRYLNGFELFPYTRPQEAIRMDTHNYNPHQGTPLYDQTYDLLQEVLSAMSVYADTHDVFTLTCILTDGADLHSQRRGPSDVRKVVERMLASGQHIVAGLGVRDGQTDFHRVFLEMGIPEQWILVLEREEGDIVSGMTSFAQTSRGIRDRHTFTQTSMGGFAPNPTPPGTPNNRET